MQPFTAASGLGNPHLQTLLPRFIRRQPLFAPVTQRLEIPDGDFVDLAWTEQPDINNHHQPIMILFHGLEGSFNSPYANGLLMAAKQQGWLGVMMHFRGCSGELNRHPQSYHSGDINDVQFFIQWLRQQFPQRPFMAVGVSLGGNVLINYLANCPNNNELIAAQAISPPLNLASCSDRIQQGFSRVYQRYLLTSLKRTIAKKIERHPHTMPVNQHQLTTISSVRQFDQAVTAPLHGFKSANDYYQHCSGLSQLTKITLPLRIIHAKDDPFMNNDVIPSQPLPINIDYHLSTTGGHVGFISGSLLKPQFWLEHTVPEWFQRQLRLHQSQQLK
ncbi:hydrolase [Photobacterium toruni]|uniref:Putative hydrolase n=1 Tax=Photobacterium toruni TaxID=1935446 RepID=A0A1T4SBQ3_9GAMM|nr:hydrolase [Photobacterium toruni]SKA25653.1 putative hydrolase [Photobacterium toruni]